MRGARLSKVDYRLVGGAECMYRCNYIRHKSVYWRLPRRKPRGILSGTRNRKQDGSDRTGELRKEARKVHEEQARGCRRANKCSVAALRRSAPRRGVLACQWLDLHREAGGQIESGYGPAKPKSAWPSMSQGSKQPLHAE
jgi:hypothetical protein